MPLVTKERRNEIEREFCDQNEYFIYQCTDKEIQKGRVVASRAKSAQSKSATASSMSKRNSPGVPLSQIRSNLSDLEKVKNRAPVAGKRKLSDPGKEKAAQDASDKITRSITRMRYHTKPVSKRIDDALSSEGLRGGTRSRARTLTATKSARAIKSIFK
jgi:hypothetical protein